MQDADVIGRTMMKLCVGTFASKVNFDQFLVQDTQFTEELRQRALNRF
jgi:hypothetical protein